LIGVLDRFLDLDPRDRTLYQVGRRMGVFSCVGDLEEAERRAVAENTCTELGITPENVDSMIDELMKRFI